MQVERIIKFINDLKSFSLTELDSILVNELHNRFSPKESAAGVRRVDVSFLLGIFKSRWESSIGDVGDYTLYSEKPCNLLWIAFSKDLAPLAGFNSYLKVLIPHINEIDCNTGDVIDDTVPLNALYHTGGKTSAQNASGSRCVFYTTNGLLAHLLNQDTPHLSTFRSHKLVMQRPSALTVHELYQLMVKRHAQMPAFEYKGVEYDSLWKFMTGKIFPQYMHKGKSSWNLLGHLSLLLGVYYKCKASKHNFAFFRTEVSMFLNFILRFELDDINRFYLIKITDKTTRAQRYMFEFLNELSSASSPDMICDSIATVVAWMGSLHQALSAPGLLAYRDAELQGIDFVAEIGDEPSRKLYECQLMLLFFLIYKFPIQFYSSHPSIILWDVCHVVPQEVADTFEHFARFINKQDSEQALINAYTELTTPDSIGRLQPELKKWLSVVSEGTLLQYDINFYDPALLLHALINFKPRDPHSSSAVHVFLDKLIQISAQSGMSDCMKALRINIEFTKFLKNDLSECLHDKSLLLAQLRIYASTEKATSLNDAWIANVSLHIVKQMGRIIASVKSGLSSGMQFFPGVRRIKGSTLMVSGNELTISAVIDAYQKMVTKNQERIEPSGYEQLHIYLKSLRTPMRPHNDLPENIKRSLEDSAPFNAFT